MLTVGIWGGTGFMGGPFSKALIKAHREKRLRFVFLHRPETNLGKYPADVEKRCLDLEHGDVASAAEQLKDLNVVISAVSWSAFQAQYRLVDALKGSPNLITFFPCEYSTPHRDEDFASPFLVFSLEKNKLVDYCAAHGVPCTRLANATVPVLLFSAGSFSSFHPAENKMTLYWPLGQGTRGLTSEAFSGQALVYLLLNRLHELPNKSFSLVEIHFSAQDLIAVFTKLHGGEEPAITKYSEEEYQEGMKRDFISALGAAGRKGLAAGTQWPGEVVSTFPGWQQKTLEDYVKHAMTARQIGLADLRTWTDLTKE